MYTSEPTQLESPVGLDQRRSFPVSSNQLTLLPCGCSVTNVFQHLENALHMCLIMNFACLHN
jgi:hypothetical protein